MMIVVNTIEGQCHLCDEGHPHQVPALEFWSDTSDDEDAILEEGEDPTNLPHRPESLRLASSQPSIKPVIILLA